MDGLGSGVTNRFRIGSHTARDLSENRLSHAFHQYRANHRRRWRSSCEPPDDPRSHGANVR